MSKLKKVGLSPAKILLPKRDFEKWAVVACDQYTSEPEYWQKVDKLVGDAPSTLRIMLPEVYLEEENLDELQNRTVETMSDYLNGDVFQKEIDGMIYVERKVDKGYRRGLMTCVDLEQYNYKKGSTSLIRATEGTIEDRLPPRVEIRQKAKLELPHIMLLIDDKNDTIFSSLEHNAKDEDVVYDFELMEGGGRIKGYKVNEDFYDELADKLEILKHNNDGFLFAVGDGNHSLATAKQCWEIIKPSLTDKEREDHPARFALIEIVNLHDDTLVFESIHRLLENVHDKQLDDIVQTIGLGDDLLPYYRNGGQGMFLINTQDRLCAAVVQEGLTKFIEANPDVKIDYIHGDDTAHRLSLKEQVITFILPAFDKSALFATVIQDGALPRKSFSMGHAHEKRFYLEVRKIVLDSGDEELISDIIEDAIDDMTEEIADAMQGILGKEASETIVH